MFDYYFTARLKLGEYTALSRISAAIANQIKPIFVVPSPLEVDPEERRPLTIDELAYKTGSRLGKHWFQRVAFLDTSHVDTFLGSEGISRLYEVATGCGAKLSPVGNFQAISQPYFRDLVRARDGYAAVQVLSYETDPREILSAVRDAGLLPEKCTILLNLEDLPFEIEGVDENVSNLIDALWGVARWDRIVPQASTFPRKNNVKPGKTERFRRHEWFVLMAALKSCSVPTESLGYSDFGADSCQIKFPKKAGGRAIRHIRYSTAQDYIIFRAGETGTDEALMREVCRRIVFGDEFFGTGHSYAGGKLWDIANGIAGPGNASVWRELNTAHHVSMIVRDLGAMAGKEFARGHDWVLRKQLTLLSDEL